MATATGDVQRRTAGRRSADGRGRAWIGAVALPWALSRLAASLSLILGGSENLSKITAGMLVSWDSVWNLLIVRDGYGPPPISGRQSPWPFFPAYPGLVKAVSEIGIPDRAALVLVSNGLFLLGLAGLWRLARRHFGDGTARIVTWIAAFVPMGIVYSMGYSSALFFTASVWAFVLVEERRDGLAALALLAGTAARPNGAVLALAVVTSVVLAGRAERAATTAAPSGAGGEATRKMVHRIVVLIAPSIAFVAVWCGLLWHWTGDPLVFLDAKTAWKELTIIRFFSTWEQGAIPHVIVLAVALPVTVVAAAKRWIPPAWSVFAALYVLPSFGLGIIGIGRYAGECFPVVVAGAIALRKLPRPIVVTAILTSAVAMCYFGVLVARFEYIP